MNKLTATVLGIFLLLLAAGSQAAPSKLSPEAEIALLTAGPGKDLYAVFGHSALWVSDPANDIDEVYNWGTFDFDTPNFYSKFLQGRLLYQLSVSPVRDFLVSYDRSGRWVEQQSLNLSTKEKQRIYDFLQLNRRPENIHYLYDFFYDNCATRIRDILDKELDMNWGTNLASPGIAESGSGEKSFRELLHPYTAHIPWTAFGIDILLGIPADKTATGWDAMFLPDHLFESVQGARHADGRPMVKAQRVIVTEDYTPEPPGLFGPSLVLWAYFFLGLLALTSKRLINVYAKFHFVILGLLGIVVFFMWFFSDHIATGMNLDLLWTLPTHLYFIFRVNIKKPGQLPGLYFKVIAIVSLLFLATWPINPQDFHPATFPMVALSAVLAAAMSGLIKTPVSLKSLTKRR
ncbi:MAG: DUF4105 domain-containing protein [Bacteroidales bacterium]